MTDAMANPGERLPAVEFDPELVEALAAANLAYPSTMTEAMIPQLREEDVDEAFNDEDLTFVGRYEISEVIVDDPGSSEAGIPLLIGRPRAATEASPLLYVIHGGGMVIGNSRSHDVRVLFEIAAELGMAMASVEYRLAPENPHPAPIEDCYAGLVWIDRERGAARHRPFQGHRRWWQRWGRARCFPSPAGARSWRPGPRGPAPSVSDVGRPKRILVGKADGSLGRLGPRIERHGLEGSARRFCRWGDDVALRGGGPRG